MVGPETSLVRIDPLRLQMARSGQMVVDATVFASDKINVEPEAIRQLYDAACLPPAQKVLATADIHVGFGIPIGAVLGLEGAIMPPAVGYDINCGMRLLLTPFSRGQINTETIADSIARDIPLGEGMSNLPLDKQLIETVITEGVGSVPKLAAKVKHRVWEAFDEPEFADDIRRIEDNGRMPADMGAVPKLATAKGADQLGTLGGGNHFIEIQFVQKVFNEELAKFLGLSENQIVVMIHSGSRRLGYEIADEYMNVAARQPEMEGRRKMLSYLPTDSQQGYKYIMAMGAAANFAFVNRHIMTLLVRRCFARMFGPTPMPLVYDVPHNMAKLETHQGKAMWVHRKGATRAFGPGLMTATPFEQVGQPIITPGSMGTASYIMVGTGNSEESLCSVNHGAGRVMSRTAASGKGRHGRSAGAAMISDDEFKRSMAGIKLITADRRRIKEEAPGAYKDIDEVVRIVTQCGWARPVARMVPLAVLKG
jgi:tRNA-splicing ligase RtcB (3'-phosphate/5'-hydroxy nucleic acid ligase)